METFSLSREQGAIQWKQLWSLAALYGSVVIGWIAYQNYQPKLLDQFRFNEFSLLLTVCQAVILVATPPLAGKLGDRYRIERGHRLPVITAGISFAAMVFMAVAFTLLGNPGPVFKWILPVLIICWLVAMSIFTSPALSTLELFTPLDKLPRAMAVLTIVANVIYAVEPVIVDIIDYVGAPFTFMAGGMAVFIAGYFHQKYSLALFRDTDQREPETTNVEARHSKLAFIFTLGLAMGIPTSFLFNFMPSILGPHVDVLAGWEAKLALVAVLLLTAFISLPASALVNKLGMWRSFGISLVVIAVSVALIAGVQLPAVALTMSVVFAAAFSLLSVSALPLAMSLASHREKVFSVGIFFSGTALPEGLVEAIQAL